MQNTTAQFYGVSICIVATFYSIVGGMHGIVACRFYQIHDYDCVFDLFGTIAMQHLANSGIVITDRMPLGWDNQIFGKELGLNWSKILPEATKKLKSDGYKLL